jgi:hypothetical protein
LRRLEHFMIRLDNALSHSVMIAQINEYEVPVIANPMHPAG